VHAALQCGAIDNLSLIISKFVKSLLGMKLATYFSGETFLNTCIFKELAVGGLRSIYDQKENQVFMKEVYYRRISLTKTATCLQTLLKFIYT
jgi:hypothetical protein